MDSTVTNCPTVKLPIVPRTLSPLTLRHTLYHETKFPTRGCPYSGFITRCGLPCRSLSCTRRLRRLICNGQIPKQPPPPSNMFSGERVCGGTTVTCSFCNRQVTRVTVGEEYLCLAPDLSPPFDCYFDDSAYSVASWYGVPPVVFTEVSKSEFNCTHRVEFFKSRGPVPEETCFCCMSLQIHLLIFILFHLSLIRFKFLSLFLQLFFMKVQ